MLDAGDDTGFWAASSGGSGTKQGSPGLGAAICGTQPSVTTGEGRRGELTRLAAVSGRLAAGGRRGREPLGEGRDGRMVVGVLRLWMGQDPKFKRQLPKAEEADGVALPFFFLPVTEYGEMGRRRRWKGGRPTAKSSKPHRHTRISLYARALRWYFFYLSSTGGQMAQNATLF